MAAEGWHEAYLVSVAKRMFLPECEGDSQQNSHLAFILGCCRIQLRESNWGSELERAF